MRPLRDFHPKIHPYITGCPEPTLNSAMVEAAIRFCQETHVIHQTTPQMPTDIGFSNYGVEAPSQQRVCAIKTVWVDGQQIRPVLADTPKPQTPASGRPTHYWAKREDSIFELVLWPTPDAVYQVNLDAAYCPTRDAQMLEDDLFEEWLDAIRSGTLAALLSMPGQGFTDFALASASAQSFARQIGQAKRRADNVKIQGSHSVRPRPFV